MRARYQKRENNRGRGGNSKAGWRREKQSASKKTYFITIGSLFASPSPATILPPWINHRPIPDFCLETSRALPAPILENDLLFKASLRALVSTPCRCTSFPPLLGKGANLRGSLFSSMECIHQWIERGTAGREPVACVSVEITWNFEFLQLGGKWNDDLKFCGIMFPIIELLEPESDIFKARVRRIVYQWRNGMCGEGSLHSIRNERLTRGMEIILGWKEIYWRTSVDHLG